MSDARYNTQAGVTAAAPAAYSVTGTSSTALVAGAQIVFKTTESVTGAIQAIASASGANLAIQEFERL